MLTHHIDGGAESGRINAGKARVLGNLDLIAQRGDAAVRQRGAIKIAKAGRAFHERHGDGVLEREFRAQSIGGTRLIAEDDGVLIRSHQERRRRFPVRLLIPQKQRCVDRCMSVAACRPWLKADVMDGERRIVRDAMKELALRVTWKHLKHYFDDIDDEDDDDAA